METPLKLKALSPLPVPHLGCRFRRFAYTSPLPHVRTHILAIPHLAGPRFLPFFAQMLIPPDFPRRLVKIDTAGIRHTSHDRFRNPPQSRFFVRTCVRTQLVRIHGELQCARRASKNTNNLPDQMRKRVAFRRPGCECACHNQNRCGDQTLALPDGLPLAKCQPIC